mmetsp:Transcript_3282/g.10860  ORF Transcript_3282/g.10860 Transcript_3282/m.10860 type:complete len:235 (+) Transcript_3282:1391-2095(+)
MRGRPPRTPLSDSRLAASDRRTEAAAASRRSRRSRTPDWRWPRRCLSPPMAALATLSFALSRSGMAPRQPSCCCVGRRSSACPLSSRRPTPPPPPMPPPRSTSLSLQTRWSSSSRSRCSTSQTAGHALCEPPTRFTCAARGRASRPCRQSTRHRRRRPWRRRRPPRPPSCSCHHPHRAAGAALASGWPLPAPASLAALSRACSRSQRALLLPARWPAPLTPPARSPIDPPGRLF